MHPSLKRTFNSFLRRPSNKDHQRSDKNDEERFKGQDVKEIRKKYNLSQRCFANMLDISVKTLQNYEVDRYFIPSTSRSLFLFANENVDLFIKYYLNKVDKLLPYRDSMNKKVF